MSHERLRDDTPRIRAALDKLANLVQHAYPEATFQVTPAEDDPTIIHLVARVDVDDPEEVANLVMDWMLELQLDEGLPISLIPLRTLARIAALREYTDEQIEQFERADVLDGDALEIARRFDQATGGSFFQDRRLENASDPP